MVDGHVASSSRDNRCWRGDAVSEKLRHVGSLCGGAGIAGDSQALQDEAQRALVLVERRGLKARFCLGAHNNGSHMSAAVRGVVASGLVKNDDQQSILLKRR